MSEDDARAVPLQAGSRHKVRARSGRLRWTSVVEAGGGAVTLAFDGYPPKFNERLSLQEFHARRQGAGETARGVDVSRTLVQKIEAQASAESSRSSVLDFQAWLAFDARELLERLVIIAMWALTVWTLASVRPQSCRGNFDDTFGEYFPAWMNQLRLVSSCVLMLLAAPVATVCLLSVTGDYLRSVAYITVTAWVEVFAIASRNRYVCTHQTNSPGASLCLALSGAAVVAQFAQAFHLATRGLGNLEKSLLQPVGLRRIRRFLAVLLAQYAGLAGVGIASLRWESYGLRCAFGACGWATLASLACYVALNIRALGRARRLLAVVGREAGGHIRVEEQWARRSIARQMYAVGIVLLCFAVTQLGVMLSLGDGYSWPVELSHHVASWTYIAQKQGTVWAATVAMLAAALVLFQGAFGGGIAARRAEARRRRRRKGMSLVYKSDTHRDAGWDAKVRRLAERGFSLRELLRFYRGLGGEYMGHFAPAAHTTEDVVRQAVIPLSSGGRCSYAEIMMKGVPTRPHKMVTHNWGNLFRDLVASIMADALGEYEYKMVAHLLDADLDQIERWLAASGKLDATYWVCAFSVSQHDGICGLNLDNRTDSVTGALHPTCRCGKPKLFNGSPPCTADGKSIGCEMNKFDDMMKYLAATDPAFEQVIAVDADFVLFSRAWCIAEIVEAHVMGMQQHLTIESMESLHMHQESLRDLRVEDMHVSRQEDKDDILGKIPDKRQFNQSLQLLIFRVILPRWHSLDVQEKMFQVGRVCRWGTLPDDKASAAFSP